MKNLKEKLKGNKKGFTLVELIIVIVILVILAAIAIPAVSRYVSDANTGKIKANARSAYMGICVAVADEIAAKGKVGIVVDDALDISAITEKAYKVSGVPMGTISNLDVSADGAVTEFTYLEGGVSITRDENGNFVSDSDE